MYWCGSCSWVPHNSLLQSHMPVQPKAEVSSLQLGPPCTYTRFCAAVKTSLAVAMQVSNHISVGDLMALYARPERYVHLVTARLPKRVTQVRPVSPVTTRRPGRLALCSALLKSILLHSSVLIRFKPGPVLSGKFTLVHAAICMNINLRYNMTRILTSSTCDLTCGHGRHAITGCSCGTRSARRTAAWRSRTTRTPCTSSQARLHHEL